ncbi:MAG: bifunctional precorrin-2 dehydrogenase/sirohydrochlorin ferrochelatase [Bacteroidota bacterium]|nr:bifunctional precorrin-2 dehydrogenase/sirohydrochlorin ferrochelatase [Bacteroidota bacterium]
MFPIFLKLNQLELLLVGGGNVGLEKLEAILGNCPDAKVTVVAPEIKNEIIDLSQKHQNLKLVKRPFLFEDITSKQLIICATDNQALHQSIIRFAKDQNILVNVADTPDLCDFYLSSVVQKGDLKIAISTNGKSPTFAKRFKEVLNEVIDTREINTLLENLNKYRETLKGNFSQKVKAMNEVTKKLVDKSNN